MREYKFYDISSVVCEKEKLSETFSADKWRIIDYEAADFSGKFLFADQKSSPDPITVDLGVEGRYHVYLGMINPRGETATGFGLLSDGKKTQFRAIRPTVGCWKPLEWFEESYYGVVDMTDEKFVVSKPDKEGVNSALAWIRLVEAEENEAVSAEPCMAYHFDLDYFDDDSYTSVNEPLGRLNMLRDGAPEIILHEKLPLHDLYAEKQKGRKAEWASHYFENFEEADKALIKEAHSMGSKIYASYRIQAGGFGKFAEHLNSSYEDKWFDEHPEYRCMTRDGRAVATASFAYPEVRRRVVEMIVNGVGDYDGACVFYHRGTVVAFEEPVKQMVRDTYGVDAERLPMSDPRLHKVLCHFVTLFMRELREALGKEKAINAIVYHSPEKSLHFGYDVKTWVDEGLVDGISQGLMSHFEDLDGILDGEGLVDMEKYKSAIRERAVVCRVYAPDYTLVTEGAREFLGICGGKADFYATLAWEGTDVNKTLELTRGLRDVGVKNFISWNTNHKAKILGRLNAEKFYTAGTPELYEERKSRYFRTLSIGGDDISSYNTDWKG